MANIQYRPVDPLDIDGPTHQLGERWRKWKRALNFYIDGQAITDSGQKHSLLLHFAGPAVQDIFETLTEPDPAVEDRFDRTVAMLDAHFKVDKNVPFERHRFRQMTPNAGETSDQFISRLRQQAQHCDFQDLNDQLRDQLVEKINPPSLRRKLLEQQNIKLVDALKITRAWEAADQQSRQITQDDVNAVSQSQHAAHHDVNRVSQPRAGTAHPHAPWSTPAASRTP